jgi:hypothetical protein
MSPPLFILDDSITFFQSMSYTYNAFDCFSIVPHIPVSNGGRNGGLEKCIRTSCTQQASRKGAVDLFRPHRNRPGKYTDGDGLFLKMETSGAER